MAKSITRCPKCKTAFRVTDAHLNTPKGAVRCGSCLNIFVARNYLINSSENDKENKTQKVDSAKTSHSNSTSDTSPKKRTTKPIISNSDSSAGKYSDNFSENEALISDDMPLDESDEKSEANVFDENIILGGSVSPTVENNLFEVSRKTTDDDDDVSDTDESWALDLLGDDGNDDDDAVYDDEFEEKPKTDTGSFEKVKTGQFSTFELLAEEEAEFDQDLDIEEPVNTGTHMAVPGKYKENSSTRKDHAEDTEIDDAHPSDEHDDENIGDDAYYNNSFYKTGGQNAYVDGIEPEAVEFSWKNRGSGILNSNKFWFGLSLAAFLIAVAQIAYFQFDKYNRIEPYRGYYKIACGFVGCSLPGLVDLSQIRAANLVVRSHPKEPGMLLVDAILQNKADYEQAFPALDLVFTDISNNPVAAKRFLPAEYLAGELAGRRVMPSNQPIHIALQIEDPGEVAVSYQMSISQAKN